MTRRTVSIVGAGIGAQHLKGYAALPDRFAVVSICDLDQARGGALAATHPGCQWTGDYQAVLADASVDIVDICLPPHLHFDACMAALEAGKTVVCEKPLVPSLAQADQLAAKAAETGRMISPVFQYRYGLGTRQLQGLMAKHGAEIAADAIAPAAPVQTGHQLAQFKTQVGFTGHLGC